jgi:hypothetical protein
VVARVVGVVVVATGRSTCVVAGVQEILATISIYILQSYTPSMDAGILYEQYNI